MKENPDNRQNSNYVRIVTIYMAFCLVVLMVVSITLSRLISRNNANQLNNTLSIMAEKLNTSFDMMINYITEASILMSSRDDFSFEEGYKELVRTADDMPYYSAGMISDDGTIYGSKGEIADMENHGFKEEANAAEGIYITEPYRSSVTGSNMITIFAPLYNKDKHIGSIFVTYSLITVQELAYTDMLSDKTYVFLVNPFSGNFVSCSDEGDVPSGTWNNLRLIKNEIKCIGGYDYDKWLQNMKQRSNENIVNFKRNGISYTEAYVSIDGMENWSLVIRIPIAELSNTMQQYTVGVGICAALIIFATMLLAGFLYNQEKSKAESLITLSTADPLTKAVNRRGFDNIMAKIFSNTNMISRCTYIYLDIDYFKEVNDKYGHAAGDQVLCSVANILKEAFYESGIVARIGGDEFNIFVHETLSEQDLDNIMANIRVKFRDIKLEDGTELPVTFSAGLAVYPEDATELDKLVRNADKALYHVKEHGRNNHFWYNDLK